MAWSKEPGKTNPIRKKVNDFCRRNGICTSCYGRMARPDRVQCEVCRGRKEKYILKNPHKHHEYYVAQRKNKLAYQKKWREQNRDSPVEKAARRHSNL